jgi:predicted glycoside hydrolase/deacetylase ChbG (UPF0249 family)
MRLLIVNADDYALSPGVSAGIRQAHRSGIVTTTTIMMNMPEARSQIASLRSESPDLGIGVHLNITAGVPVLPRSQVASLLGNDGRFARPEILLQRVDEASLEEIEREWRAQVECLVSTGLHPDHLDSHHHVAFLHPVLLRLFLELAREHPCAVRPLLVADLAWTSILRSIPKPQVEWFQKNAPRMVSESMVPHPGRLYTSFFGERATLPVLLSLLKSLPSGTSEIMCHPGLVDDGLVQSSSYAVQPAAELAVLTSPQVREAVQQSGIQLIGYAELST